MGHVYLPYIIQVRLLDVVGRIVRNSCAVSCFLSRLALVRLKINTSAAMLLGRPAARMTAES